MRTYTFSNRTLMDNVPLLQTLSARDLPMKLAYALAKSLVELDDAFDVVAGLRKKKVDTYAKRDEEGNYDMLTEKAVKLTNPALVEKELEELMEGEQEVRIYQVPLTDFGKRDVTAGEMVALQRFKIIKDEDEVEEEE